MLEANRLSPNERLKLFNSAMKKNSYLYCVQLDNREPLPHEYDCRYTTSRSMRRNDRTEVGFCDASGVDILTIEFQTESVFVMDEKTFAVYSPGDRSIMIIHFDKLD